MTYWIVDRALRFRGILIVIAIGVVVFGAFQFSNMPRDLLPEFGPTTVEVQTEALGLSAAEVEQLITVPMEQDLLNGVAFLDHIESVSLPGLSSVTMTFEPGTNILDARQVVAERLTQAAGLPQVSKPPQMIQPLSSMSRMAIVTLSSDELTQIDMSVLARWVMIPRLLGVEGVANVAIWGFRDQQLQVLVDPSELARHNVALSQVISTTGNAVEVSPLTFLEASLPGTGGFIDTVNQRLHVFHEQVINTPKELAEVTVEGIEGGAVFVAGEPLTLGDVTEIVTDHQPLIGDALCPGGPCLMLVIEKFPYASTPAVAAGVNDALDALSLGLPAIDIDVSLYRPAEFIDTAADALRNGLLIGAALLLLIIALVAFDWRVVLVAVGSIVSSVVVAGFVLYLLHTTLNAVIMAGLVVGLVVIVNDAITGAWAAAKASRTNRAEGDALLPAIVDSILSLRSAAFFGALLAGAVLIPAFAMGGVAGAFLKPMALAYALALAAGVLVGITLAPALAAILLARHPERLREPPVEQSMQRGYRASARRLVSTGGALTLFAVFVVLGAIAAVMLVPSLRPALKEPYLVVQLEAAPGTSLTRMDEITRDAMANLGSLPDVGDVGAHVGRASMSDQIVNVNSAEVWLSLDKSADYGAAIAAVESVVAGLEDVNATVTTYSDRRVAEILDTPQDEVVVRVYGENGDVRRAKAEEIRELIASVSGVADARVDLPAEESTVEIEVDIERAQAFGVKPGDVRRQAATLVSGIVVGNLFEDQKVFDVVVWGVPSIRDTVEDLRILPIATPAGDQVPLTDLADVRVVSNPTAIRHQASATYLDVLAGVDGRPAATVADDIATAVDSVRFPLEHHAEVLGDFVAVRSAMSRALALWLAALVLVYLLLQAASGSWRLATLVLLALPMSVSGSLIAVMLTGGDLTLGAVAGIVGAFSLAARWVVRLVRRYQWRERHGESFGRDLVIEETSHLVSPIGASAAALAVLLFPAAVLATRPGLELVGPAAIAFLGGLVTTMLLTLIVIPAAYLRWGYVAEPDRAADELFDLHEPAMARKEG